MYIYIDLIMLSVFENVYSEKWIVGELYGLDSSGSGLR
jgi:hypothetical protein